MPTTTTRYGLLKPLPFDLTDADQWGGQLNSDLDAIDALFYKALNFTTMSKGGNYTVTTSDYNSVIFANATTASFTITLPSAVGIAGFTIAIKKVDATANTVTIDPAGLETIDGQATLVLSAQYEDVTLVSDGSNWSSISKTAIASQIEAETATNNTKTMTPLRVSQWALSKLGFNRIFESAEQAVVFNGNVSLAHGLGVLPKHIQVSLRCKTSEGTYSIGDEVPISSGDRSAVWAYNTWFNATNAGLSLVNLPFIMGKTNNTLFTVTPANWAWVIRVWG